MDDIDWPRLTPLAAEQLARLQREVQWWREVFLCRLTPDSFRPEPGSALLSRRFRLTEVTDDA